MRRFRRLAGVLSALALLLFVPACASLSGDAAEKRQAVQTMRQEVLANLYRTRPSARAHVQGSPGYAVFSNANINLVLASFGAGSGVVRDNHSGRDVYMNMGEVGVGLGLGLKDFRAVFVFHDRATLQRFIESGWAFGGHADAAAKAGGSGAAVGGEMVMDHITIYQLTENGLALQATVKGTKYWRDSSLN